MIRTACKAVQNRTGHPFPFISNLSMNLAVVVRHNQRTRFARVKLPDVLPRFIQLPAAVSGSVGETFVFLEDVVKENIGMLFPGAEVLGAHLFRIIRDTDMVIQEDEADAETTPAWGPLTVARRIGDADMIIRGVCCLRPGIPGVSENIRVRSIVGRFLEHSRLYAFENGGNPEVLIGSADLMERNLNRRVEALCHVRDLEIQKRLRHEVLDAMMADNDRAMELQSDASYRAIDVSGHDSTTSAQDDLLRLHASRDS